MTVLIAKDVIREPLYAIVPISNPWRWKSRYKHAERAIKHFIDLGLVVYLVEVAFNRRDLVFADSGIDGMQANCGVLGADHRFRHKYIPLRSSSELWHKESQIQIGVQNLPFDWQQMAWLDADIHFLRPNVVGATIHALQHFSFVQMFSHARDLSPDYEIMPQDYPHADGLGFLHHHQQGETFDVQGTMTQASNQVGTSLQVDISLVAKQNPYPPCVWPGLAWASTRKAWEDVGGLMDFHIWGGADFVTGWCLIEQPEKGLHDGLHANYKAMVYQWADRCRTHIRRNLGVVNGTVCHYWHGRKVERGYSAKHRLLARAGFDPLRHLKRDYQGLYSLHDDGSETFIKVRDMMRQIAQTRNEDSDDTRMDLWNPSQGH